MRSAIQMNLNILPSLIQLAIESKLPCVINNSQRKTYHPVAERQVSDSVASGIQFQRIESFLEIYIEQDLRIDSTYSV